MDLAKANGMNLAAWLQLLENRHSQEIQLGLTRVKAVAERLSLCELGCVVITVAGTNGKGSTVATLEAIYRAAGFKVGVYTSPHLLFFNERICINQQPIPDQRLCELFSLIERARGDIHLTYFEMTTLAALYYFKQAALDVVVLEVGMGGRLDATNIIDADLAIITTVDLDHQAYLGTTINAIAHEKAGILKANQPFIYADHHPATSILEQVKLLNNTMYSLDVDYWFKTTDDQLFISRKNGHDLQLPRPKINMKSAVAAIIATELLLDKLCVNNAQLAGAMQTVFIKGRQHVIHDEVTFVFDVAHNPQAVRLLSELIKTLQPRGKVHAVFSALKDKDLCGLISPMVDDVDFWYLAPLDGQRAATESLLQHALYKATGMKAPFFTDPVSAFAAAQNKASPGDVIVIYGSFLLVSAVMATQKNQEMC